MYHAFTEEYKGLFQENVLSFVKNKKKDFPENEREYCVFYPSLSVPSDESVEFLIYGQAVNGWNGWAHENFNVEELNVLIDYSNHFFSDKTKKHSPLDFVNVRWSASLYNSHTDDIKAYYYENGSQYWFNRSFFWRVVYKLVSDYYSYNRESWDWSKKVVWSNLYKIAPAEGANPDDQERVWQEGFSLALFKKELDELKPKNAILMTNWLWAEPFIKYIGDVSGYREGSEVVYAGKYKGCNILVTTRPFVGNGESHVASLLEIIGKHRTNESF